MARVYFDNSTAKIPVGSQVKAEMMSHNRMGDWLAEISGGFFGD